MSHTRIWPQYQLNQINWKFKFFNTATLWSWIFRLSKVLQMCGNIILSKKNYHPCSSKRYRLIFRNPTQNFSYSSSHICSYCQRLTNQGTSHYMQQCLNLNLIFKSLLWRHCLCMQPIKVFFMASAEEARKSQLCATGKTFL